MPTAADSSFPGIWKARLQMRDRHPEHGSGGIDFLFQYLAFIDNNDGSFRAV